MDEMDVLNRAEEMVADLLARVREDPRMLTAHWRDGLLERLEAIAFLLANHAEPKT